MKKNKLCIQELGVRGHEQQGEEEDHRGLLLSKYFLKKN